MPMQTFLPGPGPFLTVPVNESVRSAVGTHTGVLAGRLEFQAEIVVESAFTDNSLERDRVLAGGGLGLGSAYDYNFLAATSAEAAENARVLAGLGLGAGSQTNFTGVISGTDEGRRVLDAAGIGGGSQSQL